MKKEVMIDTMNTAVVNAQTKGIGNVICNSMISAIASAGAATITMDVTGKMFEGASYALTGNALSGHAKVVSTVASAAAGVYVGMKAGSVTRHAIENYENSLLSRDASAGLVEEEEEEETVEKTESTESATPESSAPEQK